MRNRDYIRNFVFGMIAVLCFCLSFWQGTRAKYKQHLINKLQFNAQISTPVKYPSKEFTEMFKKPASDYNWSTLSIHGEYVPDTTIYLDNRSYKSVPGVHVLSAFKINDSDSYVWVNRGWVRKAPGTLEKVDRFINGELFLPQLLEPRIIQGKVEVNLMQRIELSQNEIEMQRGFLWQNANWPRLNQIAINSPYLANRSPLPFILWRSSGGDEILKRVEVSQSYLNITKHISYAVQWFFFGIITLVFGFLLHRKPKNVV